LNIQGGNITSAIAGTFSGALASETLDTGQGAYELYDMDQDVKIADAVTFATLDTGQGANELYEMDQNVLTTSDVTFGTITGSTLTDGTLSITDGNITLAANITATKKIQAGTFSDGTLTITGGAISEATNTNWDAAYTHVSSDGSDHTYIDQDVTSGSAPTFTADNLSSGGSNAIITTTQETNFTTAYNQRGSQIGGDSLTWDGSELDVEDDFIKLVGDTTGAMTEDLKPRSGNFSY